MTHRHRHRRLRTSLRRLGVYLRRWGRSIVSLHGSPHAIALGFALGMFIAFTPTVGIQIILAALLATFLGANRIAAIVPVWITNPLTIPPIFLATYKIGRVFTGGPSARQVYHQLVDVTRLLGRHGLHDFWEPMRDLLAIGAEVFVPMLIGGVLVGTLMGGLSYPLVLWAVGAFRRLRTRKRQRRRDVRTLAGASVSGGASVHRGGSMEGTALAEPHSTA